MRQLVLNIEESRYALLLQFLHTLDYVKIVQALPVPSSSVIKGLPDSADVGSTTSPPVDGTVNLISSKTYDIAAINDILKEIHQRRIFTNITDPVEWQKQLRDEWN